MEGIRKGYHLSMEGIRKGLPFVNGRYTKGVTIFGYPRNVSKNVRKRSSGLKTTFGESSESVRKSSENRKKVVII